MANGKFAGGDGSVNNPYLIEDAFDLDTIRNGLDKCYKLIKDIDLNIPPFNQGEGWNPITRFNGIFNGNIKKIKNLYIKTPTKQNIGVFGVIIDNGILKNTIIENCNTLGCGNTGSLCGIASGNCVIEKCKTIGGLINGTDSFSEYNIGGLTGGICGNAILKNCYANSKVNGRTITNVGGLVGCCNNNSKIINSHSIGEVTGNNAKGLCGGLYQNTQTNVINSYWDIELSKQTTSEGGIGKTTKEMQTASTFVNWNKEKLDNGTPVWILKDGQYPKLWFEVERKYLIEQNENYYSINNHYIDISKENNNLENLIKEYGYSDISILTKELSNQKIPTKVKNNLYESFDIELNDVKGNMELIEEEDKKYIKYDCEKYKILDKIKKNNNGKFDILMKEMQ